MLDLGQDPPVLCLQLQHYQCQTVCSLGATSAAQRSGEKSILLSRNTSQFSSLARWKESLSCNPRRRTCHFVFLVFCCVQRRGRRGFKISREKLDSMSPMFSRRILTLAQHQNKDSQPQEHPQTVWPPVTIRTSQSLHGEKTPVSPMTPAHVSHHTLSILLQPILDGRTDKTQQKCANTDHTSIQHQSSLFCIVRSGPHAGCAKECSTKFSTLCSQNLIGGEKVIFDIRRHSFHQIKSISKGAKTSSSPLTRHRWHTLAYLPGLLAVVGFFQMDCRLCRNDFVIGAAACENFRESPIPVVMIASSCLESMGKSEGLRAKFTVRPCFLLSVCVYMFPFNCDKIKYQIVESRSTQVRTIHECDTQLLYGASGTTVSEDGSCRASDTCALQGTTKS